MDFAMKPLKNALQPLLLGFVGLLISSSLLAAPDTDWPKKPIVAIVSFPAGGSTDIFARAVMAPLGEALGQSIVIENKPGGGGQIGAAEVARASGDGQTLLAVTLAHAANVPLYRGTANYDFQK